MTANITPKFQLELAKLEQTALLDLFEVDMQQLTGKDGNRGELFRFYAGTNELTQPIIWQGNRYTPFGVKAEGFEMSGQGASNRPTLTVVNFDGFVTTLSNNFEQCLGAIVRRRQVYAQFLDAANFKEGNRNADPQQERVSYYLIEQLTTLTQDIATFTLALPTETDNALINKRTILVTCPWVYRSTECGYTGNPVADEKDQPTTDPKKDKCSGCLRGCQLRNNTLNYGGFIGVNKLG
ncbi:phage minor tail protein L [Haemophilus paraphrohaemolyticus]|uniref:Phage minor tail protein L n=1 Tax=Haemophilus paraphrohaemolyticus HK411 TaxID=1095743 RepID=I2NHB9_9PAST|nr:phage minor tail protein L [Haemophilus paraphrohaemolyticus]EIG25230.1 phage minor tail protein L [Haemophilus paraphrohaemolyticus HK411]OOR94292.1 phage minor tail protein L [Haemophilus paraphrohaemolyticus]STP01870.1 phage minor tail protein L [Haemophilus paraphrohaemolyticus]DAQ59245.1 MAG TPA: minor tail protein L [Caudoviricetes sp.]